MVSPIALVGETISVIGSGIAGTTASGSNAAGAFISGDARRIAGGTNRDAATIGPASAVSVRVRGQELRGAASIMEDPAAIAAAVAAMVAKNGEAMARRMGVLGETPDSPPRRGTVFVQIDLEGA